ncbi:MAG: SIMPL domain-containing protein [Chloroflexota bacterium]
MKHISALLNGALCGVLVFVVLAVALPRHEAQASPLLQAPQADETCNSSRSIQVSGTATVNVIPDRALIQLGVESNGFTPTQVEAINSATIQRITQALNNLGIESKDIVTDRYIIDPVYDSSSILTIKGYRINNLVAITLRDINLINRVIVAALEADANEVVNVELYTSELRKYRDQARELAIRAAGEKASALANAAGADTGCVLHINEDTWSSYNGWWWYGRTNANLWTQNVIQNAAPTNGGTAVSAGEGPITLGQIAIRAEVSVSYSLK